MPPSAAPEWLRVGWSFEMTATSAPASYASIAARIPAQPAPTTRTSWVASTRPEASGTTGVAAALRRDRLGDPQRPVTAVDPFGARYLAEARADESPPLEQRADPLPHRHEAPGTHLPMNLGRRLREIDDRIRLFEGLLVLPTLLRNAQVARLELREHLRQ